MNKFIKNIIAFSLKNKFFTFFWVFILVVAGVISFINIPIETYPDVTNTQITIITQWKGQSAEEVERFVTTPIEIALSGVQKKTSVRSTTMFGLSVVKVNFEDDVDDPFARQQVNNLLKDADLPDGLDPQVQPPTGPTGEIYRYILKSKDRDSRELLTLQNWVIDREFRRVPGVADVNTFGGQDKVYEISADPLKLQQYNLTPLKLYDAIASSNINVGGDVIEKHGQAYVVRGLGLLDNVHDIENTIVDTFNGNPLLVKNIATVSETSAPRLGQTGMTIANTEKKSLVNNDDVVEGIVVMRKGENPTEVLARVKDKVTELNTSILPSDVKLECTYDRSDLMSFCTETVMHNLLEGIILVTVVVFLFMADWRTTLIVGIIIPLALLFAFFMLKLRGMSANLLSLGAVDFGIIIDGAVVMVEGIFVALDHEAHKRGMEKFNKLAKMGLIRDTGIQMGKAIFFSKLIIISALLPIFTFQKVEGKMFSPLAFTLGFALLGALIFTLTLVPLLSSILLKKNVKEKSTFVTRMLTHGVAIGFNWTFAHKKATIIIAIVCCVLTMFSTRFLGTEFLPQLNEGALWVDAQLPMSYSLPKTVEMASVLRKELSEFPEVNSVVSQTGRSNDGTDPCGFYLIQMQVNLKPKKEWKQKITQEQLVDLMDKKLKNFQGITFNYSQPISDNVEEAVAGMKAANAVKIFGDNLDVMDEYATKVLDQIKSIPGIEDAGVVRNLGQPEISVTLDEEKMAMYGVTKADAQAMIEMAIGGKTATQKYEGEKKFDIRVRYSKDYRKDEVDIMNLMIPNINGNLIPLKMIAAVAKHAGPAFVFRDNGKRYIGVKFSVRGRDLGSTISEAQAKVNANVKLPTGYHYGWAGEFENQVRATKRLGQTVPISLVLIFVLLFIMFGNVKDAGLVLYNVPFSCIGGILGLLIVGQNFGISAGVGFIALFGICVQNGVILISEFHKQVKTLGDLNQAVINAVKVRARPVLMTACMAIIGLMPAAMSTGIGSESQKPLAIVIIGGLITDTIFTLLVFPIIYHKSLHIREGKKTRIGTDS